MRLHNITFDAHDPGRPRHVLVDGAGAPGRRVGQRVLRRIHVDLDVDDLDEARRQLESIDATFVHERDEHGVHWYTFQDIEGNEFCVARHGD